MLRTPFPWCLVIPLGCLDLEFGFSIGAFSSPNIRKAFFHLSLKAQLCFGWSLLNILVRYASCHALESAVCWLFCEPSPTKTFTSFPEFSFIYEGTRDRNRTIPSDCPTESSLSCTFSGGYIHFYKKSSLVHGLRRFIASFNDLPHSTMFSNMCFVVTTISAPRQWVANIFKWIKQYELRLIWIL